MGPVEEALENKFLSKLMGLQSISGRLMKLLDLGSKRTRIRIPNTTEATEEIQLTSLAYSERLVESLLSGESLSKIEHRECLRRSSRDKQDIKKKRAEAQIDREKRSENNKGRLWL